MCRSVLLVVYFGVFILLSNFIFAQTPTTVKDVDGFEYKIVRVGGQTWMAQNLNVTRFRNGDPIPEATTTDEWIKADKNKTPAWCYFNNDPEYGASYGKLYNWYAVIDERGLAPAKWRIPTEQDWVRMINFLGNKKKASEQLKADFGWREEGYGSNKTGFNALPGGNRSEKGQFLGNGSYGYWWSSQEHGSETAEGFDMGYRYKLINQFSYRKGHGFSVRCVK
jgi:uncharacterized protein (TIGR02145 family)